MADGGPGMANAASAMTRRCGHQPSVYSGPLQVAHDRQGGVGVAQLGSSVDDLSKASEPAPQQVGHHARLGPGVAAPSSRARVDVMSDELPQYTGPVARSVELRQPDRPDRFEHRVRLPPDGVNCTRPAPTRSTMIAAADGTVVADQRHRELVIQLAGDDRQRGRTLRSDRRGADRGSTRPLDRARR